MFLNQMIDYKFRFLYPKKRIKQILKLSICHKKNRVYSILLNPLGNLHNQKESEHSF